MGDRVAVMRKGELQQVAPPQELTTSPVNLFVGGFIGSPAMNMLEATLERSDGGLAVERRRAAARAPDEAVAARPGLKAYEGRTDRSASGPSTSRTLALAEDAPPDRRLRGKGRADRGARLRARRPLRRRRGRRSPRTSGSSPRTSARPSSEESEARPTSSVASTPAPRCGRERRAEARRRHPALHFFDPETGAGIYAMNERSQNDDEASPSAARACARVPLSAARRRVRRRRRRQRGAGRHRRRRDRRRGRSRATSRSWARGRARSRRTSRPSSTASTSSSPDVDGQVQRRPATTCRPCSRPRSRAATRPTSPSSPSLVSSRARRRGRAKPLDFPQDASPRTSATHRHGREFNGSCTALSSRRPTSRPSGTTSKPSRTPASRPRTTGTTSLDQRRDDEGVGHPGVLDRRR